MRIALYQMHPCPSSIDRNVRVVKRGIEKAKKIKANVVAFPEAALIGYGQPEQLFANRHRIAANMAALNEIAHETRDIAVIVGYFRQSGENIFNSAAVLKDGRIPMYYDKVNLALGLDNTTESGEGLFFTAGKNPGILTLGEFSFWLCICLNDINQVNENTAQNMARNKTKAILAISYSHERFENREIVLRQAAEKSGLPVFYVNAVDNNNCGQSTIMNPGGEILKRAPIEEEALIYYDLPF